MIKIEKDLTIIPASLQLPPNGASANRAAEIRQNVIQAGKYPKKSSTTDKRYKMEDIKSALFTIYNGKCAFCEQRVERWQVEHFRPKSIYYWLAFSWDNLLYACPDCNGSKSNHFDLDGQRETTPPVELLQINSLSETYDATELRKFIHPELEDPEPLLIFQKDGFISSADTRVQYTLDTCQVYRKYLNDYRKKIWDDFINDLKSEVVDGRTKDEIKNDIMVLVRKFKRDAEQVPSNEFLAFRRFALKHFLTDSISEILG